MHEQETSLSGRRAPRRYLAAFGASLLTAALALPLLPVLDAVNVAMLFLLMVVLVAIRLGRGPRWRPRSRASARWWRRCRAMPGMCPSSSMRWRWR